MEGIGSRVFACLIIVAVHLLLWRMLAQVPPLPKKSRSDALTVIWVDPSRAITVAPPLKEVGTPRPGTRRMPPTHSKQALLPTTVVETPTPPPNATEIMAQARDWVIANQPIVIPPDDPLTPRRRTLPGSQRKWLPTPPPRSTREGIDRGRRMMGEVEYLEVFCPKLRLRISELEKKGDSLELQQELRRLHAYCQ